MLKACAAASDCGSESVAAGSGLQRLAYPLKYSRDHFFRIQRPVEVQAEFVLLRGGADAGEDYVVVAHVPEPSGGERPVDVYRMARGHGLRLGLGAAGGHDEACCQNSPCREVFESLSSHPKGKVNQIQEYTAGR